MENLINTCIGKNRAMLFIFIMIIIFGGYSYMKMPRELNPNVQVPIVYVTTGLRGISPEDSERLLVIPMEDKLRSISGVKKMTGTAAQNVGYVVLEFFSGYDIDKAMEDVRAQLGNIDLPKDADEPLAHQINVSLFPIISVALQGGVPDRTMFKIAKELKKRLEAIPNVLSADISGVRDEVTNVIIDPDVVRGYNITIDQVVNALRYNNVLTPAGTLVRRYGAYPVQIDSLVKDPRDIMRIPLITNGVAALRISDIANVYPSFVDPTSFARVNGEPCVVLEVSKRIGTNMIETINQVKSVVSAADKLLPSNVHVNYIQDQSLNVRNVLNDLTNNIIFAVILVFCVVILVVGTRVSLLVALSIPGSFLIGVIFLNQYGCTLNIVVLFSLIMSIGMLVDAPIVICEYADRYMIAGKDRVEAYKIAARHMLWPVMSSTITTIVVFMPLLFWPGVVGQFMKYLPITLIATLTGSLIMALVITPVMGGIFAKPSATTPEEIKKIHAIDSGEVENLGSFMKGYANLLKVALKHSGKFVLFVVFTLVITVVVYVKFGPGVEFFPKVDPDEAVVKVKAHDNMSIYEIDDKMKEIESYILKMPKNDIKTVYTTSGASGSGHSNDTIGRVHVEFADWRYRRKPDVIMQDVMQKLANVKGVLITAQSQKKGPSGGKPIEINLLSNDPKALDAAKHKLLDKLHSMKELNGIEDNSPIPKLQIDVKINRDKAAIFGTNAAQIGVFMQLVTNGVKISSYRPITSDADVDIMMRFPKRYRTFTQLSNLFINTQSGSVPVSSFVTQKIERKVKKIIRLDGERSVTILADVNPGSTVNDALEKLAKWFANSNWNYDVHVKFGGQIQDQKETSSFLSVAFMCAIAAVILTLLVQFNSVYSTFVIMTEVFLSTTGILLGLFITNRTFGIVMCGVGIVGLTGVVVNNGILLIDAYQMLLKDGVEEMEAIFRAAVTRVRPILLTASTAILGLIPMITRIGVDFVHREITYNAPSSQWWVQLSTTIGFGLAFATILTLFFVPALLVLGKRFERKFFRN